MRHRGWPIEGLFSSVIDDPPASLHEILLLLGMRRPLDVKCQLKDVPFLLGSFFHSFFHPYRFRRVALEIRPKHE